MNGGPVPVSINQGVETKVAVGSSTTIVAGYIAWALVTYVPGIKDTIPADLQGQLPVLVAFALASIAAYFAPHTHRTLPPLNLTVTPPPPAELIPQQVPPAPPQ